MEEEKKEEKKWRKEERRKSRRKRIGRRGKRRKRRRRRGERRRSRRIGRRGKRREEEDADTQEEGDFEVTIRGVETPDFSMKLTQVISEINRDKVSEQQTEKQPGTVEKKEADKKKAMNVSK